MTKTIARVRRCRDRISRRRFIRGAALGTLGFCTACAVDAWGIEPEWIELVELELPLKNPGRNLVGLKMVHISDLHLSRTVSEEYLRRCIQRVNRQEPDIVVLTGDYVTYDSRDRFKKKVVEIIGQLRSKHGVFACLGNHDYGVMRRRGPGRQGVLHYLINALQAEGVAVLRNEAFGLDIGDDRLWLVGLGDLWSGDFKPDQAFRQVTTDDPTIVLAHNPDCVEQLTSYRAEMIMSGHTHGGQVRLPLLGSPFLPIRNRRFSSGMFDLDDRKLYVNRGLGRLGRIRFNCRPEITVFTLSHRP